MDLQNVTSKTMPAEFKRVWAVRGTAAVVTVGGLALLAPVIWSAVVGGAGLVVGGIIAVIGVGLFQTLPLLAQKTENKILAARKAEARARPIEQLQNYYIAELNKAQKAKENISEFGARIKTMQDLINERKKNRPNYDSTEKDAEVLSLKKAHAQMSEAYVAAEAALKDLADKVEDMSFDDKLSDVGEKAIQSMNANTGDAAQNKILTAEAFDAVRTRYNTIFSNLELATSRIAPTPALSHSDGMTIEMQSVKANATLNKGD